MQRFTVRSPVQPSPSPGSSARFGVLLDFPGSFTPVRCQSRMCRWRWDRTLSQVHFELLLSSDFVSHPSSPHSTSSSTIFATLGTPNSDAPDHSLPVPERGHHSLYLRSLEPIRQRKRLLPLRRGPSPRSIPYPPGPFSIQPPRALPCRRLRGDRREAGGDAEG